MPQQQHSHSMLSEASYHNMTVGRIPVIEGGIQPTIFDAKADLLTATANDTPARLAVGANNTVLTADSSTATGLKWAAAAGGGKVLQVVQGQYSTSTAIASTTRADSGLSLSITPSLASSKILVMISQPVLVVRTGDAIKGFVYVMRNSTDIVPCEEVPAFTFSGSTYAEARTIWNYNYLDSPATTSAVTYKTQGKVNTTSNGGTIYFQAQGANGPSTMILLEIGA
jgi:hypothetical protein